MSDKKKNTGVETTTLTPVPMEQRKSWLDVAFIQAGIMICVPSLLLGGMLAGAMDLIPAIISGAVGYGIVIILFCLMGIMGSDLGVPTCMTSLGGFGRLGTRFLISTVIFASMIGWFAVQNTVCGEAFSHLLQESFGVTIPSSVSTIIWGIIMLVTAVYGVNAMDKLNMIAVPCLFVMTIVGTILALRTYGTANLSVPVKEVTMSFADGVILTINFMAAGVLAASDITRYQRTRKDTILSSSLGVWPAGVLMVVLGAIMTKVANQYDITQVFVDVGLPILGMLVLIAATWTTNTSNAYSGGINAVMVLNLSDNKRSWATMISGALGTVLALMGLANSFEAFLNILGEIMLPMVGIIIADYWIIYKGDPKKFRFTEGFNWFGIISWAAGYAIIKLVNVGVPFAQGIIAAMIIYVILTKLLRKEEPTGRVEEIARKAS